MAWVALTLSAVALGLAIAAIYLVLALGREWIREGAGTAIGMRPFRPRAPDERVEEDGLAPAPGWYRDWQTHAPDLGPPPGPEATTTEAHIPAIVPGDVDDFEEGGHDRVNRPTFAPNSRATVHDPETGAPLKPGP